MYLYIQTDMMASQVKYNGGAIFYVISLYICYIFFSVSVCFIFSGEETYLATFVY